MIDHLVWPLVVLVLGGFALLLLRKPFARLVDRITNIDRTGIRAATQQITPSSIEAKQISSRDLMEVALNPVIGHQESSLREYLANIQFSSDAEREALLIRALARSQVYSQFERLSMLIYGPQLELLVDASSRPAGIDSDSIAKAFEKAKTTDPVFHEQTASDTYRGFLLGSNLLTQDGDRLKITIFGKEFLKFLVDNSLTQRRRG